MSTLFPLLAPSRRYPDLAEAPLRIEACPSVITTRSVAYRREVGSHVSPLCSMVAMGNAAMAIGQRDANVLHHPLILVIENVAMKHEVADIALVAGAHHDRVLPRWTARQIFDEERVLP